MPLPRLRPGRRPAARVPACRPRRFRPLIVKLRIGGIAEPASAGGSIGSLRRKQTGYGFEGLRTRPASMQIGMVGRAAVTGAVHDVDLVAFLEQHGGPAATAVGRAHPIQTLPAAAVHQHDRVRVPDLGGNLITRCTSACPSRPGWVRSAACRWQAREGSRAQRRPKRNSTRRYQAPVLRWWRRRLRGLAIRPANPAGTARLVAIKSRRLNCGDVVFEWDLDFTDVGSFNKVSEH